MTEKKSREKKQRRSYLNDFQKDASGQYRYCGAVYRCTSAEEKKLRVRLFCLVLCTVVSVFAAGCVPAAGMRNCFYVILPYVAEVVATALLAYAAFAFLLAKRPLYAYVYEKTVKKIPLRAVFVAVYAGIGIVCLALYLILGGTEGRIPGTVAYIFLKILNIGAAYCTRRTVQSLKWLRVEPSAP